MCHPSMDRVLLNDVSSMTFDFKNDIRIPAVLVCLVTEVQYRIWNGNIVNQGLSLLMMRRGFEVGALPGVWSMIAGVRDIVSREGCVPVHTLSIMNALKEIEEETGIPVTMLEDETVTIGNFLQPNPAKPEQCFYNVVVCASIKPGVTPGIRLCHEHTGAVWIPVKSIRDYLTNSQSLEQHRVLGQVIKDGMAPNTQEVVLPMLLNHLDSK